MPQNYHDIPQPYRIQKRLVLNQCFRSIYAETGDLGRFAYVTLGGDNLYDVMDLVGVFDIRRNDIAIFSYEYDRETAVVAQQCSVARTLSHVRTISVQILPVEFPDSVEMLEGIRHDRRFVYFLDYQGTFTDRHSASLTQLLSRRLLIPADYVMITSCLSPRIVHQPNFMLSHSAAFGIFYGSTAPDRDFRVRNHTDLLVANAVSRFERDAKWTGQPEPLRAVLLRKFRYRDSRAAMGLWLYRIEKHSGGAVELSDSEFEEFPHSFVKPEVFVPEIPNIFD